MTGDAPYFSQPTPSAIHAHIEQLREEIVAGSKAPTASAIVSSHDELIGRVSWHWEHEDSAWARCGVTVFDPSNRGQGAGRTALALLADEVFTSTGAIRLDFATWSGNRAMCRVGELLGWRLEGRFREAREVRGKRYDSVVYGILRGEWRPADATGNRAAKL